MDIKQSGMAARTRPGRRAAPLRAGHLKRLALTLLIGGGSVITLPMLLFSAASGNDPVITAVLAMIFALPALLALVIALRYLRAHEGDERNLPLLGKPS